MKNVVLNIIYKLRLELPSAVSGCGDEVDGCWCLAAARRRMSGPSLPRCQLLATINTDHWPWDLEPSHQWSQEASWQQRWRLIRLLLSLDNKFTFILISSSPFPKPHKHTTTLDDNSQARSRISEYLSVSVSCIRSRGHRTRIAGGDNTQTPGLVTTEEAQGDASGTGQSWSLSSPLHLSWRFAFELQHHYGQKSWDSKVKLSESFIILILSAVKRQKLFSP